VLAAAAITPTWVDIAVGAAAVLAALVSFGIIWRKFLHPMFKTVVVISEAAPTLLEIATEYKPNGGGSLHDVVDRIEAGQGTLASDVREHIADDREAFKRIDAASEVTALTALRVAAALEAKTEDTAAELKTKTEDTAAELKTKTEDTAAELKTKTEEKAEAKLMSLVKSVGNEAGTVWKQDGTES
jgi:hypothetical protein